MELSKLQIENLYHFTKQHYVVWYDLQSELVDHLANDIEHIWEKEPHLSFEQAKNKSFKKFGVFGFMEVVEKKQKALNKRYLKLIWNAFIAFFSIPKIIFTISLFFSLLFFIRLVNYHRFVIIGLTAMVILIPFVYLIKSKKEIKIKEKSTHKKWMFEDYITNLGGFGVLLQFPFQILIHFIDKDIWSLKTELFFTITFIVFGLFFYIAIFEIPSKIRTILANEHPEYLLTKN